MVKDVGTSVLKKRRRPASLLLRQAWPEQGAISSSMPGKPFSSVGAPRYVISEPFNFFMNEKVRIHERVCQQASKLDFGSSPFL